MKKSGFLKKTAAALSSAALLVSFSAPTAVVNAAVVDPDHPNNYDNFAEALQLAICFYDANKCGDEVANDGYYSWRANCHVKDAEIPLQPMNPMPKVNKGKTDEELGDGQGVGIGDSGKPKPNDGATDPDLYVGVNMSDKFIEANRKYLDPDGNGTLDLTGGWHDAGDHVKFGLPGSYSASTLGWGYYEFPDAYKDLGLDGHIEDELRWINDYFMKVTFLDDDDNVVAYCYQVGEGNNDHNYWCAPELQVDNTVVASSSCAVKRPAYFATTEMPASDQCAGAAASLAINYLNFKDSDPDYAAKNLKYAKALYDFAVKTHTEELAAGATTPVATSLGYDGGFYTSSYDYDELAWAAVWLYYCTENYDYINDIIAVDEDTTNAKGAHPYVGYFKRIMSDTGNCWQNIWVHCWDTVWGGVFAKLAPVTNTARDWYIFNWNLEFWSGVSPETAAAVENGEAIETKDDKGNVSKTKPMRKYFTGVTGHKYFGMDDLLWNMPFTYDQIPALEEKPGNYIAKSPNGWAVVAGYGSARYNTAAGLQAMVFAKETGDMKYAEWAKDQMEYILGDNPMGYAYEVGYENSYASLPHHRSSHCSAKQSMTDPVNQVHTLWGALVGGPDLNDYHLDETKEYIYNEVTDDYNAAFCGDLAGLYYYYGAKGKELADKNKLIENFDMSKNAKAGFDQIDEKGNPLPTGLYVAGGKNQEQDSSVQLKIVVYNRTINPPKFESDLRARYYFNISEMEKAGYDISCIETRIDYDQEKSYSDGKNEAKLTGPFKYDDKGTYYVDIQWKNCDFYGSRVYQFAFTTKMDEEKYVFPKWDSSNDYSYDGLVSFEDDNEAAAITDAITLYADDKLIWGVEPDGTKPEDEPTDITPGVIVPTDDVVWGDADCDGLVKMNDAVLVMQSLSNGDLYGPDGKSDNRITVRGQFNANVYDNSNSGITPNDALQIQKFLLKMVKSLDPKAAK